MNRRPSRWHIGAVALALLVVAVATGAAVGHSAPSQTSASDTLVDGTTDSITNLDPAGTYDFYCTVHAAEMRGKLVVQ